MADEQVQFNDKHKITLYGMGLVPDPQIEAPYAYMIDGETVHVNPVVWNGLVQALLDSKKIGGDNAAQLFYYQDGAAIIGKYPDSHEDFITKLCLDMATSKRAGMHRIPMTMGRARKALIITNEIVKFLNSRHGSEEFDEDQAYISAIILRAIAQE